MAYLRSIEEKCQTCGGRATVQLVNNWNAPMGRFCKKDGASALKRQQRTEDEARGSG